MSERVLVLHQLSLRDVTPVALVGIARQSNFAGVSVFLHPPAPQLDIFPRLEAGRDSRKFAAALRHEGVLVHNVEAFPYSGRTDPTAYLPYFDLAAQIGAKRLTALVYDKDLTRAADLLSKSCDDAQERGLKVSIEFMAYSSLQTLAQTAEFIRKCDHPALSQLVDPLHLLRTGGKISDLAAQADTIGALQFCDAMAAMPSDPFVEAIEDRVIPGEGEIDLQGFLEATDPRLVLDVEVPMKRLALLGMSPLERALKLRKSLENYIL